MDKTVEYAALGIGALYVLGKLPGQGGGGGGGSAAQDLGFGLGKSFIDAFVGMLKGGGTSAYKGGYDIGYEMGKRVSAPFWEIYYANWFPKELRVI